MADRCTSACSTESVASSSPADTLALPAHGTMSLFAIAKMDCPSEEQMVRMALDSIAGVDVLQFDLAARQLRVLHQFDVKEIDRRLQTLNLGARLIDSTPVTGPDAASLSNGDSHERQTLWWVLAINAFMFVVEFVSGWLAQSAGLLADSLDMFADAAVYGLSLYAVGRTLQLQQKAAHLAGLLQLLLALGAVFEVVRRFLMGSEPHSTLMMGVSTLALVANVSCLLLLARHRSGGVHMKASWIFSTNDVVANAGVIIAGVLVAVTGSAYPDLLIGLVIGLVVLSGAVRILRLKA